MTPKGFSLNSLRQADETITLLRAKVAEQKAEIDMLRNNCRDFYALVTTEQAKVAEQQEAFESLTEYHHTGTAALSKQLAISQLSEKKLREALELWAIADHNAEESELDDMACYCVPMPLFCDACEATEEALATPSSTEALDAYVEEKVAKLTRQRDLAVEALNNIATTTYSDDPCGKYVRDAREALSAIKESEDKK